MINFLHFSLLTWLKRIAFIIARQNFWWKAMLETKCCIQKLQLILQAMPLRRHPLENVYCREFWKWKYKLQVALEHSKLQKLSFETSVERCTSNRPSQIPDPHGTQVYSTLQTFSPNSSKQSKFHLRKGWHALMERIIDSHTHRSSIVRSLHLGSMTTRRLVEDIHSTVWSFRYKSILSHPLSNKRQSSYEALELLWLLSILPAKGTGATASRGPTQNLVGRRHGGHEIDRHQTRTRWANESWTTIDRITWNRLR